MDTLHKKRYKLLLSPRVLEHITLVQGILKDDYPGRRISWNGAFNHLLSELLYGGYTLPSNRGQRSDVDDMMAEVFFEKRVLGADHTLPPIKPRARRLNLTQANLEAILAFRIRLYATTGRDMKTKDVIKCFLAWNMGDPTPKFNYIDATALSSAYSEEIKRLKNTCGFLNHLILSYEDKHWQKTTKGVKNVY